MDKHCANCIYRCYITAGLYCCDYIDEAIEKYLKIKEEDNK